jgi:hypothetical protein
MSAKRRQSAVLRLLRGEALELVSRELTIAAAELSAWRDAFLAAGEVSFDRNRWCGRPPTASTCQGAVSKDRNGEWRPWTR